MSSVYVCLYNILKLYKAKKGSRISIIANITYYSFSRIIGSLGIESGIYKIVQCNGFIFS